MKRMLLFFTLCSLMISATIAGAWPGDVRVISYGADLSAAQRAEVFKIFGLKDSEKTNISVTEVTNKEEREYLHGLVSSEVIGSKAISCAYVKLLDTGQGINVQTHNINWVTPEMYANSLVTAGVKDAKVIAAAPFPVSGTAALTGIIKAFEVATGKNLSKEAKDVAHEEIVQTGEIAKAIDDSNKATKLIVRIKEEVVRRNLNDPQQIRLVVVNISNQLNIKLTEEQINRLVSLMQKINGLELNASQIDAQLKEIRAKLDLLVTRGEGIKGIFQNLYSFLVQLIASIRSLIGII